MYRKSGSTVGLSFNVRLILRVTFHTLKCETITIVTYNTNKTNEIFKAAESHFNIIAKKDERW